MPTWWETPTHTAVVVDPAWDGELIVEEAKRHAWQIQQIWLTHAHFDHIGGIEGIVKSTQPAPKIALHPADLPLYSAQGGAALFGMRIGATPEPTVRLKHGQILTLGDHSFEVRHCPGIPRACGFLLRSRKGDVLWGCDLLGKHWADRPARWGL